MIATPATADAIVSPFVNALALEERAGALAKRSIKRETKLRALDLAIRVMDLTTLEGADTPGRIATLCAKALHPDPLDTSIPPVAAVCVYPSMIAPARRHLNGSPVKVASVATAFPAGQTFTSVKIEETRRAAESGAEEIDMVIDRGAFLRGDHQAVMEEIAAIKEACGGAQLKVILETGELGSYDAIRRASDLAIAAGADFIKTSTGKIQPAATPAVALTMMEAIRDERRRSGRMIGLKPAGGIRTAKQAVSHLVLLQETLGSSWMRPDLYRIGASALLNDVLLQIAKERAGAYWSSAYVTEV